MKENAYAGVRALLEKYNLQHLYDRFVRHIKETLILETASAADDEIQPGASKIGGLPDLPGSAEWPSWNGNHLSFVAQINLDELPGLEFLEILPETGILSFFYDLEQQASGFDPEHKRGWRVVYSRTNALQRRNLPEDLLAQHGSYSSCSIVFRPSISLPDAESIYIHDLGLDAFDEHYLAFQEEFYKTRNRSGIVHRLLGHPDPIQNPMEIECQMASNGIYYGDLEWQQDPRVPALQAGLKDWQLLLQIDSDEKASMMWGDVGRIYYWMRADDLAARKFDEAWMVFQCC